MRRSPRTLLVSALVIFVVVVSVAGWLSQRTRPAPEVRLPTIEQMVRQSESFEGEPVRVTGTVRAFAIGTPGEHFVLEDAKQNRVEIYGVPRSTLNSLTDGMLTIEGEFHFEDGIGRYIDVTSWATPAA